jgi:hypothetical protein
MRLDDRLSLIAREGGIAMPSQILRPTKVKVQKRDSGWRIHGPWGRRAFEPMSAVRLYRLLHRELVASGVLPPGSPVPSNRHHLHVTMTILRCSWVEERWVLDATLPMAV